MKKTALITLFILTSIAINAQLDSLMVSPDLGAVKEKNKSLPEPAVTIDIDFLVGIPTGEFKDFYSKKSIEGLGLTVLVPISKKNPFDFGVSLGYYFMSTSKKTFPYYSYDLGNYDVESRVSGGMFEFSLVTRIYPLKFTGFPVQPYFEGLAGFKVFGANHRLRTYVYGTDEYLPVDKDYNYTGAWSYGIGAGVKIQVDRNGLIFLNLKASNVYGTPTKNMDPESVRIYDDGTYSFDKFKSRTDIARFGLGIHFMIE